MYTSDDLAQTVDRKVRQGDYRQDCTVSARPVKRLQSTLTSFSSQIVVCAGKILFEEWLSICVALESAANLVAVVEEASGVHHSLERVCPPRTLAKRHGLLALLLVLCLVV